MPAGRPRKNQEQQVEIQAVPEGSQNASEEDHQSDVIEWCRDPDCRIPVTHIAHEALALPSDEDDYDPGPTGFGKNAYFTPPEERLPSHVTLDRTI